jgi:hypothetical protein
MLLARNGPADVVQARQLLSEAVSLYKRCGMPKKERRIRLTVI